MYQFTFAVTFKRGGAERGTITGDLVRRLGSPILFNSEYHPSLLPASSGLRRVHRSTMGESEATSLDLARGDIWLDVRGLKKILNKDKTGIKKSSGGR